MKLKFKPWQIGLITAACIVVLGGAGVGIYFGVNHAIDSAVDEKLNSALETMTDTSAEPALDETGAETPTQTPGETDSSTPADPSQPKREPETVTVYVTAEPDKPETSTKPETQTETERETEPQVELVYDEQLTKEVADLLSEKYSTVHRYTPMTDDSVIELTEFFENQFNSSADFSFKNGSTSFFFAHQYDNPTAEDIVSDWSSIIQTGDGIVVWRAAGNWIFAALEFR